MFEEDNVMFLHLKKTKLAYALNQMGSVGEIRSFPGMWILGVLNDSIQQ